MGRPTTIRDVTELEELLSEPSVQAIEALTRIEGDILILGVAGKMGPTLARMAKRASETAGATRRVIGVARFSVPAERDSIERHGVETIQADLLDEDALARLPDTPNIVYMAGRKFGSSGDQPLTWALNAHLPGLICRRFPASRIAAFSTGNVYGLRRAGRGGSREADEPQPVGEYAMSCLGRERVFEHYSRALETPVILLRLNYATEMRYGVLVDLARKIHARKPVDLTMGFVNVIWQADANAMALAALAHAKSPAAIVNIAGPEEIRVRDICVRLASLMNVDVTFTGVEAEDALLSNGEQGWRLLGRPQLDLSTLLGWTADWVAKGGASLDKPTYFESRAGRY
jgi:dTDP-4-dehydrorhamnose reductase